MIFGILIAFVADIMTALVELFPTASTTNIAQITANLSNFKTSMGTAGYIFPVDTFFTLISIVFTIEASMLAYKVIRYIARHISLGFIK